MESPIVNRKVQFNSIKNDKSKRYFIPSIPDAGETLKRRNILKEAYICSTYFPFFFSLEQTVIFIRKVVEKESVKMETRSLICAKFSSESNVAKYINKYSWQTMMLPGLVFKKTLGCNYSCSVDVLIA